MNKPITSKTTTTEIKVENELGFVEIYKVYHRSFVDVDSYEPEDCKGCKDGLPHVTTHFELVNTSLVKGKKPMTRPTIIKLMKNKNLVPSDLMYQYIFVGFVYADSSDPNNFKWWLDFRDDNNQSIYNIWGSNIELDVPFGTTSWLTEPIWHGRYLIDPKDIERITEIKGKLIIKGKQRKHIKHVVSKLDVPKGTILLRVRFDVKQNLWYVDFLDKDHSSLSTIAGRNLSCDVFTTGKVISGEKPKVSTHINIELVKSISITVNNIIIKGYYD